MTAAMEKRLVQDILGGSVRALARGISRVEAGGPNAEALSAQLFPHTGRAHVVGITGTPGSGKSTLAAALAKAARERGLTVGIIAIDPTSPFSGGSILGDRIRMTDLALDAGIFVRSMATRGVLGGLCRAAADAVDLMDASGRDVVLVETVGVGQDEVDIMRLADTVVVVSVPGLGDDIQTLKAGLLEIAHVHVVNKADRSEADRTAADLRSMLHLAPVRQGEWVPPVLTCVATRQEGISSLLDALLEHMDGLTKSGELTRRRARAIEARVLRIAQDLVADAMLRPDRVESARLLDRVARRELTPQACARALLTELAAAGKEP